MASYLKQDVEPRQRSFLDPDSHHEEIARLDERTILEVSREYVLQGDETVRITKIHGPKHQNLLQGQYLLGANIGNATISFVKMPESMVKRELKRLRDSGHEYHLIVSDGIYETNETFDPKSSFVGDSSAEGLSSETKPYLIDSSTEEQKEELFNISEIEQVSSDQTLNPNPQAFTPSKNIAFNPQEKTPTRIGKEFPRNDNVDEDLAEVEIQRRANQSLERLRSQRVNMQRMKTELVKRDMHISSLTSRNAVLEKELLQTRGILQDQKHFKAELEALREKYDLLVSTMKLKEQELVSNKKKSRALEELLRSSINQEKEKIEYEKATRGREVSELKALLSKEKSEKFNLSVQLKETSSELNIAKGELVKERDSIKQLAMKHKEHVSDLQRQIMNRKENQKELTQKLENARLVNEERKQAITTQASQLLQLREEKAMLEKTVSELEGKIKSRTSQLLQLERKKSIEIENLKRKLGQANDQLKEKVQVCEKQQSDIFALQRRLDVEIKAKGDAISMVNQKEVELANANMLLEKAEGRIKQYENDLKETNSTLVDIHDKMLSEKAMVSSLQNKLTAAKAQYKDWTRERTRLLKQFCEEEARFE